MSFRHAAILAAALAATGLSSTSRAAPLEPRETKPQVEVVFCLDTTGSMSGLIEGAKQKIWSIVNQIASGRPAPDVKVGLLAYRDRGDVYVTRVFDLTDDLDEVHKNLREDGSKNNVPDEYIANVQEQCQGNYIKLSVAPDAKTYTVSIPGNGHSRTYDTR